MHYITFALLFKYEQGLIVVLFIANVKSFLTKKCNGKPQAEGKVNSRLYSRTQKKKVQHSSAIKKKQRSTIVSLSEVIFAY